MSGLSQTAAVLREELAQRQEPIGLAFSGGPDSLALLNWASETLQRAPVLLHVHHGFGAGSDGALASAEAIADRRGLELRVASVQVEPGKRGLEAAARRARYKALETLLEGEQPIALGHGWDDWIESLWLRLLAGSSPLFWRGPALRQGRFVRPLLDRRQAEYRQVYPEAFEDPMNGDERFDRVRLRRSGLLGRVDPDGEVAWALHCLGQRVKRFGPEHVDLPLPQLPTALRRLVIRAQMRAMYPEWRPRNGFVEEVCKAAGTKAGPRWFSMAGERLHLRRGKLVLNREM